MGILPMFGCLFFYVYYSLSSLKGGYMGDYIGHSYKGFWLKGLGDIREIPRVQTMAHIMI